MYWVYILRTSKNTLYIGQTNNLEKRIKEHNQSRRGAKYLKYFETFELVYKENHLTRSDALKREFELKKLTKIQKEMLILR